MMSHALLRNVRILDLSLSAESRVGEALDVRVEGGRITEIGEGLASGGATVHEGNGGYLAPGLWDEHVHLSQWVLGSQRINTAGTSAPEEVLERVRAAVAAAEPGVTIQGWGHRLTEWTREPTVAELDEVSGDHPVVLIAGDAHHGWMNSKAMELVGLPPYRHVVREEPWFAIIPRLVELPGVAESREAAFPGIVAEMNARGLVGVCDYEFTSGHLEWPDRYRRGVRNLRVKASTYEEGLASAISLGIPSGESFPDCDGRIVLGSFKAITDGSLGTQTALCCDPYPGDPNNFGIQNYLPERLEALMRQATEAGIECAIHAIGDAAMRDALACFAATGARGSIEHAQLINPGDGEIMARLGIRASVQPHHLHDDRDAMEASWPGKEDQCFALRDMLDAGVDMRLGSDAPVSPLDPWLAMGAAVHRSADDREPWYPEQALSAREAFAASTGGVREIVEGMTADLILLEENPLEFTGSSREVFEQLTAVRPLATFLEGELVAER